MDCKELIHPFQNDPGVSQRHRIMESLLSGAALIDGRSVADLLDYFVQLSKNINYYDKDLTVSDWQPFFSQSLPFALTEIIKLDRNKLAAKTDSYNKLLNRKSSKGAIRLLMQHIYNNLILPVNNWQARFTNSGLPTELRLNKLIKDKLAAPLKEFIICCNASQKWFYTKGFDFNPLSDNEAWGLEIGDVYANLTGEAFQALGNNKRKRLLALRDKILNIVPAFADALRVLSNTAPSDIEQSFFPLKEELRKTHPPHLAILFAFLKLFKYLQDDLNSFTKKHLDFFYKDVLKLKAHGAVPDEVHLVFEIQARLDKYLLKKGLLLKDGKDNNKAEILFATDDEIVLNKAQVADQRTLFLNNRTYGGNLYAEGVYMAPDATKADGIGKEFKDEDQPAGRATLGAQFSKYADPENKFIKPYPNARLGFILASPVLLLNEGRRTVTITLNCELSENICATLSPGAGAANPCCTESDKDKGLTEEEKKEKEEKEKQEGIVASVYKDLGSAAQAALLEDITKKLNQSFYYINRPLIADAVKKGISKELLAKLNGFLVKKPLKENLCYCPAEEKLYEITLPSLNFSSNEPVDLFTKEELAVIGDIFIKRRILNVAFSGEKGWVYPFTNTNQFLDIQITSSGTGVAIVIKATLLPEQEAVTSYNAEKLKEDFNTTLPLVKIELDDKIKIAAPEDADADGNCCKRSNEYDTMDVSMYHFFRNLKVKSSSKINVEVCDLRNLIVQNDENLENVNSPVRPFGVRPKAGASFYIGSKEIFSKNWQDIYINAEWKDRPLDFKKHYEMYAYPGFTFEDGVTTEIVESTFKIRSSVLDNGEWKPNGLRRLFKKNSNEPGPAEPVVPAPFCNHTGPYPYNSDIYTYSRGMFTGLNTYGRNKDYLQPLEPLNVSSKYGFLKLTLEGLGFQHDIYGFVLARQMMDLAGLVNPVKMDAIVKNITESVLLIPAVISRIAGIRQKIVGAGKIQPQLSSMSSNLNTAVTGLLALNTQLGTTLATLPANNAAAMAIVNSTVVSLQAQIDILIVAVKNEHAAINSDVLDILDDIDAGQLPVVMDLQNLNSPKIGLKRLANELKERIDALKELIQQNAGAKIGIPNEPYTPTIRALSIDYTAAADINDIDLIHLYPYTGTYKNESITASPSLLPTFCDEGTLFIGLKDLQPGSNVNMLFQLAEATADSEAQKEDVNWYYLENNAWKLLRPGFEVLDDDTDGLTTSGIVKFALPANMTDENTILPKGLRWIKSAVAKNSRTVSETIAIYTQAIKAAFTNNAANDALRLANPLPAGSVAKFQEADSSVKKITQPYDTFGGRVPEGEGHFYVRASEQLRHKGRAIQKFDYERLVLEAFPKVFKVKCINHSFALDAHNYVNDIPLAPGYVLLAVIPDLNQLKAAKQFEPKIPAGMIEDIQEYIRSRTSPFVRFKVMNPRYEKVDFCLKVKLYQGRDESYYKERLKQDLREFLAPWAVGVYDKLSFGQCISQPDLVAFMEGLDYLDYILELKMRHEDDEKNLKPAEQYRVCPISPRSILIAGDIDVCIQQADCEQWDLQAAPCDNKAALADGICNEQ